MDDTNKKVQPDETQVRGPNGGEDADAEGRGANGEEAYGRASKTDQPDAGDEAGPEGRGEGGGSDADQTRDRDFRDEVDALRSDLKSVREDIGRLRAAGGEAAEEAVQAARRRLEDEAGRLMDRLRGRRGETGGEGEAAARNVFADVQEEFRERPTTTLLASFGVGVLVGWMLRRR